MIFSLLYIVLAALGLGFLIFIHEFGHYIIARKEGMTVEVFSIGFGKPFYSWEFQGVKWQFCYVPFGGYVRIAGMEKKGVLEPYQIPDGFYGKRPWARIKVALAGPIVNIAFAFIAFLFLFLAGGRLKPFSEYTHLIGWVDHSSSVYQADIRPGDQIQTLNHKPFRQFQDLLYAAVLEDKAPEISGQQIDYFSDKREPFTFQFPLAKDASTVERISHIWGSLGPASYLIYNRYPSGKENPLAKDSPIRDSGIAYGDRILWVDGELVFSREQLVSIVNQSKVLLTIQRGNDFFLARVPRLKISDLRISSGQKAELADWHHEAKLPGQSFDQFFIPYNLTPQGVIEGIVTYLNDEALEQEPPYVVRSNLEAPLLPGDKIVAVDGAPISSSYQLLQKIQKRSVQIIVKTAAAQKPMSYIDADAAYVKDIDWNGLNQMIHSIGTAQPIHQLGNLKALQPITPLPKNAFPYPDELRAQIAKNYEAQKKAIDKIEDPERRQEAERMIEQANNQLMLGIVPMDAQVIYNPSPFTLFGNVFKETYRTLMALFSGNVSPKYMQGPVGIVQVMHHSWTLGFKEALFWLGMISLNLGVLNLLPIPVLDGGHICFSLWEAITKKPLKAKTMERLIIPFVVLLVGFFVYLTYHDLMRLFMR